MQTLKRRQARNDDRIAKVAIGVHSQGPNAGVIPSASRSSPFYLCGLLASIGFKHGRWVDSVLMQHPLGLAALLLTKDMPLIMKTRSGLLSAMLGGIFLEWIWSAV